MSLAEQLGRDPTGVKTGFPSPKRSAQPGQPSPRRSRRKPTEDDITEAIRQVGIADQAPIQSLPSRLLEGMSAVEIRALLTEPGDGAHKHTRTWVVALFVGALILVGGVYVNATIFSLPFAKAAEANVLEALVALLIISLFVERAQHVYIGVIRGFGRAHLDRSVTRAKEILEAVALSQDRNPQLQREALQALHSKQDQLTYYRMTTRKGAFLVGLATGIVIALIGPRVLESVVDPAALEALVACASLETGDFLDRFIPACPSLECAQAAANQLWWFNSIDVILTGGLIGGGAEGIHKIVSAITGTADRVREQTRS